LHPYKPPTIPGQQITPQSPVEVEGKEEYIVEEILDSHLKHNKLEFLVKWEGYTNENNLWEPKDNCKNAHTPLPPSTVNILRHQDELCRCNLIISSFNLIRISCN